MLVIANGALVSEQGVAYADLAIEDGRIARVAPGIVPRPGDEVIDASGLLVFPGFIDGHVHFEMRNASGMTADSFETGTRAAVAGGTTTVVHFATQDRGHTLREALDDCARLSEGRCSCDYAFHMSITDLNERTRAELDDMFASGISSFKLYFAYDGLRVSDADAFQILCELKARGGLVGVHCENGDLVDEGVRRMKALGRLSPAAHPASRPPVVEAEAVNRLLAIAELAGCAVNIVHLSSREGLLAVRRARERGQRVLAETCPQYLLLNDERYREPDFAGARYVCSPPLRPEADRRALEAALLHGEIDTVATDHCSYTLEQKALGREDFSRIPNGLPGVEHRPALLYSAYVAKGLMSLGDMCKALSANPARQFGMWPRKGALRPGSDADIVLWDPDARGRVSAAAQLQNTDYTPYEGFETTGAPRRVLLRGETVYERGRVVREKRGRYVRRAPVEV